MIVKKSKQNCEILEIPEPVGINEISKDFIKLSCSNSEIQTAVKIVTSKSKENTR
jgi:hypothetical protein